MSICNSFNLNYYETKTKFHKNGITIHEMYSDDVDDCMFVSEYIVPTELARAISNSF